MLKTILLTLALLSSSLLIPLSYSSAQTINKKPLTSNVNAQVKILVASWCVHCRELEQFLQERGIAYLRLDIEKDSEGKRRYEELGGGGVPMVVIGNSILRGFDKEAILELLQKPRTIISERL